MEQFFTKYKKFLAKKSQQDFFKDSIKKSQNLSKNQKKLILVQLKNTSNSPIVKNFFQPFLKKFGNIEESLICKVRFLKDLPKMSKNRPMGPSGFHHQSLHQIKGFTKKI